MAKPYSLGYSLLRGPGLYFAQNAFYKSITQEDPAFEVIKSSKKRYIIENSNAYASYKLTFKGNFNKRLPSENQMVKGIKIDIRDPITGELIAKFGYRRIEDLSLRGGVGSALAGIRARETQVEFAEIIAAAGPGKGEVRLFIIDQYKTFLPESPVNQISNESNFGEPDPIALVSSELNVF